MNAVIRDVGRERERERGEEGFWDIKNHLYFSIKELCS